MKFASTLRDAVLHKTDWLLLSATVILSGFGLITMYSFGGEENYFNRQLISLIIALCVFFVFSCIDWRILKSTTVVISVYIFTVILLIGLFFLGTEAKGSQSWFRFAGISFQPADFAKVSIILILAKYFTHRHIEIQRFRHIIVSGLYALIFFICIVLQPDFGSAMIIFFIWLGMVLVAGISYKHILAIFLCGALAFGGAWMFVFKEYQKERILTFVNPLADIQGAGYNAFQSMIAVGSGQLVGKGVGYGTQSRLQYLPEHQTDFIFASFAEEWGLAGVLVVYILFILIFWRLIVAAYRGASNFETLFAIGVLIYFGIHVTINIGMNMGMLPVTGVPLPFMSYGGSHLLAEFAVLGIVVGMRRYERTVRQDVLREQPELLFEVK